MYKNNHEGGFYIAFFGGLTIMLIAFKLSGIIQAGWVFVLMPVWVPAALGLLFYIGLVIYESKKGKK